MKPLMLLKTIGFGFAIMLLFSANASLAEEAALDDILSGFAESGAGAPGVNTPGANAETSLDDALDGFSDGPDDDEVLEGFDEEEVHTKKKTAAASLPAWISLNGSFGLASSINFSHDTPESGQTDHRDLSKLKGSFDLTADSHLHQNWQSRIEVKGFYDGVYDLKGRENYTSQVLDEYVKEFDIGEMWLQGSLASNLDLKLGRQIVVWGKSDNIRITDVLNPLDNREPGLVDIRDLRLPVAMSKVDYYSGNWNVTGIVLHENRFNKQPVYGNDFYMGASPAPREDEPGTSFRNQEFGLAINGIFSGWDLSFYGANIFDDTAHLTQTSSGIRRQHSRINMAGMAINIAQGSWLLKGETAWFDGLEYSIDVGQKSRFDLLLGAEYTGFAETMISVEIANRHILAYDDRLQETPANIPEDEAQMVLRISRDFLHDTVTITGLISAFILSDSDGSFQRLTAEYELSQALQLTTGLIFYQSGTKTALSDIGDNDRFFCELRYSF
jgi:hypothetical protein